MSANPEQPLQCIIVTPERAILDEHAEFAVLPMVDGELGIQSQHTPMVGRLSSGELRLTQNGIVKKIQIGGGFAQVRSDVITVLTSRVTLPDA